LRSNWQSRKGNAVLPSGGIILGWIETKLETRSGSLRMEKKHVGGKHLLSQVKAGRRMKMAGATTSKKKSGHTSKKKSGHVVFRVCWW
jgi:hypothetical protein